ncbi:MAG: HEAT repeat domain-containing protein [Planctomycetes bacterium]|nr:HEAT repeat domain-containing protein [Planctomycetota bacterium]
MGGIDTKERGFEATLEVVCQAKEPGLLIGLLEGALDEPRLRKRTLDVLLEVGDGAAHRLILRKFHTLDEGDRERVSRRTEPLLAAAEDLARSDERQIRANVVASLGVLESFRGLPLLLLFLDDPAPSVRERGAEIFDGLCHRFVEEGCAQPLELECIRKGLRLGLRKSPPSREAVRALIALGAEGHGVLCGILREGSDPVRDGIQTILSELTDPDLIQALLAMLGSSCEPARAIARRVFRDRRDAFFVRSILNRLAEPRDQELLLSLGIIRTICWEHLPPEVIAGTPEVVQERLLHLLEGYHGPAHAKARKLASFLRSGSPWIQQQALMLLRDFPLATYLEELFPLLDSPVEAVGLAATEVLQPTLGREVCRALILQLRSPFESVRRAAVERLAGRGIELAVRCFDAMEATTRDTILRILARVDREFFPFVQTELRSGDADRIVRGLRILAIVDGETSLRDTIIDLTVDANSRVRATVARSLARLADERARGFLRRFLRDPDPRVVANAIEGIADAGYADDRPHILPFLHHANNRVRANTIEGLWRLGDRGHLGALEGMLRDPDPRMRASGRWAANRIGHAAAEVGTSERN